MKLNVEPVISICRVMTYSLMPRLDSVITSSSVIWRSRALFDTAWACTTGDVRHEIQAAATRKTTNGPTSLGLRSFKIISLRQRVGGCRIGKMMDRCAKFVNGCSMLPSQRIAPWARHLLTPIERFRSEDIIVRLLGAGETADFEAG